MNIRFLAQSGFFNGVHIKDDIILEKEYVTGRFSNLPEVRYFLYYLEENIRKEVMPHSTKIDIFSITDCGYETDYIYFVEYDELPQGYAFNVIKYNIVDHTHRKILVMKDNIDLYPDKKQIKIFILDDSNMIIQRAVAKGEGSLINRGLNCFSMFIFDFQNSSQIVVKNENLLMNGIDFIVPISDGRCIMKTGISLYEDNLHDKIKKEDATVESLYVLKTQQFISDLALDSSNLTVNAVDQAYYDTTFIDIKVQGNFLVYSKYNYESGEENIVFYEIDTKDTYTCINKTENLSYVGKTAVIETTPYLVGQDKDGTWFMNMLTGDREYIYSDEYKIKYMNDSIIVASAEERGIFGGTTEYTAVFKYPSKKPVLLEKGKCIGCVSSNSETVYIFLK